MLLNAFLWIEKAFCGRQIFTFVNLSDLLIIGFTVLEYSALQEDNGFLFSKAHSGEKRYRCAARDLRCNAYYDSDNGFVVSEENIHNEACAARAARKVNKVDYLPSASARNTKDTNIKHNALFETLTEAKRYKPKRNNEKGQ